MALKGLTNLAKRTHYLGGSEGEPKVRLRVFTRYDFHAGMKSYPVKCERSLAVMFSVGKITEKAVYRSVFFDNLALYFETIFCIFSDCFFGDFAHWVISYCEKHMENVNIDEIRNFTYFSFVR